MASQRNAVEEGVPETSITSVKSNAPPVKNTVALLALVVVFITAAAALAVGILALKKTAGLEKELSSLTGDFPTNGGIDGMDNDPNVTSLVSTVAGSTRLFTIQERGQLNCGVALSNGFASKTEDGGLEGFDIDLCHAIAAAIFGDPEKVMFQVLTFAERFSALADDISDVVGLTTHTMERDVYQASTKDGKSFTTPYFYEGLGWGGLPEFVECADNRYLFPECAGVDICLPVECIGLKICLPTGTTWIDWAYTVFPEESIVAVNTPADSFFALSNGLCNVVGGERHDLAEETIRLVTGYTGPYVLGSKLFSKEPIALMTREDDPRWSDFVNSIVQAMFHADEIGITQEMALDFPSSDLFGDIFSDMFQQAISAAGNYAEIYARNMEALVPRNGLNLINSGKSGLVYSFPFGALSTEGAYVNGTIDLIRERGFLKCGVSSTDFSTFSQEDLTWTGYGVDYCRALASSIFNGDTTRVIFTTLSELEQFVALENGSVDVLSSGISHEVPRDVMEPTSGTGFTFSPPNFYGGLTFSGQPEFVDCAESQEFVLNCTRLLVCAATDTPMMDAVRTVIPDQYIVPVANSEILVNGFVEGSCNVIGSNAVTHESVRSQGYTGNYKIGLNRFSKEPRALITRQNDARWSDFVTWIVQATLAAEELGITKATGNSMPETLLFGPVYSDMLRNAILAVGNIGEIYDRNIGASIPRSSLNLLNDGGPQIYPLPGF